jgi:hypothetical protein
MRAAMTGTSTATASSAPPRVGRTTPESGSISRRIKTSASAERDDAE